MVCHVIHVIHTAGELSGDGGRGSFKNARVTIVTRDSTGKAGTMRYEDYVKKQKHP